MLKTSYSTGVDILLNEKNITVQEKRRIVATNCALELIAIAISKEGSTHTLSEELKNLSIYADAIYDALSKQ